LPNGHLIEPLEWRDEFLPWFDEWWSPGEHGAVVATTGAGKTTFVGGVLARCRRYVLALDAKGGDGTLGRLGFERVAKWPGAREMRRRVMANDEHDLPSRFVVGAVSHAVDAIEQLESTLKHALDDAWSMGGWTVYADELQVMTDPRMMNLRRECDRMLVAARDRDISFVSSYQSPSWVTPHASRQAKWVAVSYTRDRDVVRRLSEVLGRPKDEIVGAMSAMEPYSFMVVGLNPNEPYRVTIPDEV
jgi:hypothetical protein